MRAILPCLFMHDELDRLAPWLRRVTYTRHRSLLAQLPGTSLGFFWITKCSQIASDCFSLCDLSQIQRAKCQVPCDCPFMRARAIDRPYFSAEGGGQSREDPWFQHPHMDMVKLQSWRSPALITRHSAFSRRRNLVLILHSCIAGLTEGESLEGAMVVEPTILE